MISVLSVPHFTYHDNTRVTPSTKRIKATNPIDCFTDIPPCFGVELRMRIASRIYAMSSQKGL